MIFFGPPIPFTSLSDARDMPWLAATFSGLSLRLTVYACHDTSGLSLAARLRRKPSTLSRGKRIVSALLALMTGLLCAGFRNWNSSSGISAKRAASLTSMCRSTVTVAK
jgi:hypothetical protein